jgi:nucleoside-diphosphate-sugar epimerase
MDVLVTGGNGFVGHHLVHALLERGERVRVLVLPKEDAGWLARRGVDVYRGDICDPESLDLPMRGADAVVHLAAMMHVWRPLRDYTAVNVQGTRHVCTAALGANVERLVHMSSSSVYGMPRRVAVDEGFPLAPFDDPYPVSKAAADRLVQRMIVDEGLPAVIVRPDQIFGPGDRLHFGHMADRVCARRAVIAGRGDNALPLVYVDDIVQGLLLALTHERAVGDVFNITSDDSLTQFELLDTIATEFGAPRPRLRVPYPALYAAAYAAERLARARHATARPPLTRFGVAFAASDVHYSIAKACRELGFAPRVPLREGVGRTAAWLQGAVPGIDDSIPAARPPVDHANSGA